MHSVAMDGSVAAARHDEPDRPVVDLRYVDENVELHGCRPVTGLGLGVAVNAVATTNLLARRDPAGFWQVSSMLRRHERRLVEDGVDRPATPLSGPDGRAALAARHEVLADWWGSPGQGTADGIGVEAMGRWREDVPSARALWPLQHPEDPHLLLGGTTAPDDVDRRIWSHVADAVGIRSRAAVVAAFLRERFRGARATSWLSMGSGAVLPVMRTASELGALGVDCEVDLRDGDPESLRMARTVAERHGVAERLHGSLANLFDLQELRGSGPRYDMVDLVGLFEHLPRMTSVRSRFPSASDLLAAAVDVVRPGGVVVLANMLDTHPQIDVGMRCVQWPHIVPRSLDELVTVVRGAGVTDEQVTVHVPDDGVYAVATIEV